MATTLSLYPLGVGDFGATKLFHISFLLRVDGRVIVIDCPRRLAEMLAYNAEVGGCAVSVEEYREILLTHLHIDHAGGLAEMVNSGLLVEGKPISLYAPAPTLDYLWSDQQERGVVSAAQFDSGRSTLNRYFQRIALENPHDFGDFQLSYRATVHFPKKLFEKSQISLRKRINETVDPPPVPE